ncbi:MAG: LLM class F420-dependent oxidoreductase [Halobacteriales archaeon]
MELGVVFPQTEIGANPDVIREYVDVAEARVEHLLAYDHVLGANPREGWSGAYDVGDTFHEPLTFFSYLAGITEDLTLIPGILILPQRRTALVAKQAAEVDVLSGGRLRLGVGLGWNELEYEALGEDFGRRAERMEAQVPLLRRLWTEEAVEHEDEFHSIPDMGLNPRPVQRPIPVLMGGTADPVLRRAARLADGWLPQGDPGGDLDDRLARLREYLREEGRDLEEFEIVGRMNLGSPDADDWAGRVEAWREAGATRLAVDTMGLGLDPAEHAATVERFADRL